MPVYTQEMQRLRLGESGTLSILVVTSSNFVCELKLLCLKYVVFLVFIISRRIVFGQISSYYLW